MYIGKLTRSESILIAAGFSGGTVIDRVEVLTLNRSSDTSCDLDDFPAHVEGGVASYIGNKVVVCGGKDGKGSIRRDCVELNSNGSWSNSFAVMSSPRLFPFGVKLGNEWIVTGGSGKDGKLTGSSEIYSVNIGELQNSKNEKVFSRILTSSKDPCFQLQ